MVGDQDEPATALNDISLNATYSMFFAVRVADAEVATVCCLVAIEFILHLRMTYQIIKDHKKIAVENGFEEETKTKAKGSICDH